MRCSCEEEILRHIRPGQEEYDHIWSVAGRLLGEVNESSIAQGMVVGSIARDTWIRGDRDLDIFMLFDAALTREELQTQGLSLGRAIAKRFGEGAVEKYAEHPYINTSIEGLDIDLVPCYAVSRATEIKSAVDRTPFHTRFIRDHIDGFVDDVRLLKQFTKASGIYGSDHMTEGFAGYLCELLILFHGGFTPFIEAATKWRPGIVIDFKGHQGKEFEEPLVVIDPVDPERNVAASLSLTRMFEFVELATAYTQEPCIDFFFPPKPSRLEKEEFITKIHDRGSTLYGIILPTPYAIPDVVVPQLRKSLLGIRGALEREGFVINRADCRMEEEHCMLLFEFLVDHLPPVRRHMGPHVWNGMNAVKFLEKYVDGTLSGPYIEDGRYYVELERRFTSAEDFLRSPAVLQTSLGKHVKSAMQKGWDLKIGEECYIDEFELFLSDFLQKRSPLTQIRYERRKKED